MKMKGIRIENDRIYATKDHGYQEEGTEGGIVIGDVHLDELSWVEAGSSIINKGDVPIKLYNSVVKGNSTIYIDNRESQLGEPDPSPSLLPPKTPSILVNIVISEESVLKVDWTGNDMEFKISDSVLKRVCINCNENSCDAKHKLIIRKSKLNNVKTLSDINLHIKLYIWESALYDLEFYFKQQQGEDMGDVRIFNSDLKSERYMFRNYANVNIYGRTSLGLETKSIIYKHPSGTQEITVDGDSFKIIETREL